MLTHRKRVEREIKQLVPAELSDFHVYKSIHYVLDASGKFVISVLTILSCEAVRENYDKILPGASGIESRAITIYLPTFYNSLPAF